jgi:AcrR family transcriptional regulator
VQERARRTREQILETAAAAFARDGYEGTSLNELIRASGFTKGAFYFHFASKEELALATFRYKQEQIVERTRREAEREADAETELRTLLRVRARVYTEDPSARCILRLGAELGAKAGPDSEFARFQELTVETFAGIVRRGQAEGSMRADLDPRKAGEAIFGAMIGADRLSRLLSGGKDLEQRGQELVDLLVHGLACPGDASAARKRNNKPRRERRAS